MQPALAERKRLEFKNPGRFMENFDPERSGREMRKMTKRICSECVDKLLTKSNSTTTYFHCNPDLSDLWLFITCIGLTEFLHDVIYFYACFVGDMTFS